MVVFMNPKQTDILGWANEKHGGDWVKVNELCNGDILKFTSDDEYKGFDNRADDNYCRGALETIY